MSSVGRFRASTRRGDQYFINVIALNVATTSAANDVYDSTGASLMATSGLTVTQLGFGSSTPAAGTIMVRDMGSQVTVPGDYQGLSGNTGRRVLRKVQLICPNAATLNTSANNNVNEGIGGSAQSTTSNAQGNLTNPGFGCFYIEVGGIVPSNNTVGGVNKWASLMLPF
jgi:hypothetical protein